MWLHRHRYRLVLLASRIDAPQTRVRGQRNLSDDRLARALWHNPVVSPGDAGLLFVDDIGGDLANVWLVLCHARQWARGRELCAPRPLTFCTYLIFFVSRFSHHLISFGRVDLFHKRGESLFQENMRLDLCKKWAMLVSRSTWKGLMWQITWLHIIQLSCYLNLCYAIIHSRNLDFINFTRTLNNPLPRYLRVL